MPQLGTLSARHKEISGGSTQGTPHVLVEEQKKPRTHVTVLPTCTSLLFGLPYYVQRCGKTMCGTKIQLLSL